MENNSTSPPPCKRRCKFNGPAENPESSQASAKTTELLMMMIRNVYVRAGGRFSTYQFIHTCVLDSIMAALHLSSIKHINVEQLLKRDASLGVILSYITTEKFDEAKALWMRQLGRHPENNTLNCASRVQHHFPLFVKLVCANVDYHQETPDTKAIYQRTLSHFRGLGDVQALGDEDNPTLIWVNQVRLHRSELPPVVIDDDNRIFDLLFLLLGEETHMVLCFNLMKDTWILFDNDPNVRALRFFNFEQEIHRYLICSAAYVNTTQVKLGVPETGTQAQLCHSSGGYTTTEEVLDNTLLQFEDLSFFSPDTEP
ncbi:uncharacterized protein [Hoplias malabaricus]|uniref:uncharacterized protein n=1 Tax=Hoplias malabaricus TaxID=27720 RepID=UPI003461E8CE